MSKVNAQSIPVLRAAILGALSSVAIMKVCTDMGPKQVAGAVRNLRTNGLISGDVDGFKVLKAGTKWIAAYDADQANASSQSATATKAEKVAPIQTNDETPEHNRRTKIAKAITLFQRHEHQGRQAVLAKFQKQLGMTAGGASTYYQNVRRELGRASA